MTLKTSGNYTLPMSAMDFNIMLKPLQSVEDLQRLFELMRIIPEKTPNRYEHLTELLNTSHCTRRYSCIEISSLVQTLEKILPRFGDEPMKISKQIVEAECKKYLEMGKLDIGIINVMPPVTSCCGSLKNNAQKFSTVYRYQEKPTVGVVHELKCTKCQTVYKACSYKQHGTEWYYENVLELPYFQSSGDTIFDRILLESIDIDM